ncbi:hypothetical protein [Hymenobacter guriensis]|uniref:HEAT repeat domain-containing protein n=1 Tax=Hymenobacter guriensis TaxID=2793065 RepID=A0ABS0L7K8_9BACT|nr:hypothetical protein [Hymenobacter guriensis]MBG8556134.1 hypothetical protein [Hymenobacter guriensis]
MTIIRTLKKSFIHSVRRGTGRADLIAEANPEIDFSADIIDAALKNYAYDGQAEPSRAHYLYQLYRLSSQQKRIRRAVLNALAQEREDTWTLTQLYELALRFAQDGDQGARRAMYRRFLRNPIHGSDWVGADEIMELDGWEGLKYIARTFGQALAKNPAGWQDDDLIRSFQQQHPAINVWQELHQLAEQDEDVRRYVQNIEATLAHHATLQRPRTQLATLEEILCAPRAGYRRFALQKRGLEPNELRQLAERFVREKNNAVRENLLYVFTLFPFPLSYEPILALAQQKPSSKNRLTEFATYALRHLKGPAIREFALQRLLGTTRPSVYTDLLISNYQEGDAALLTTLVSRFHQEHTIEALACSYTEIYQANKTPECAAPLLALYHKMTCGLHRHTVVQLLLESQVLPAWLNEELPYDSYAGTRLLHQPPL